MTENTLLHRQIHPSWVQNEAVSTQAFLLEQSISSLSFIPSQKDNNLLSVYNGEKFTAEEAFKHFSKSLSSIGVLSVSKKEVDSIESLSTHEDNLPFNGHTVIDFTEVKNSTQVRKKARKLKNFAVDRGWMHKE